MKNRDPQEYISNWSGAGFYEVLEAHRPADKLAHHQAVFMCDNIDDIDNAGGAVDGSVLTLEPVGPVSRHDMNWSSEITELYMGQCSEEQLRQCAEAYWSGRPHPVRTPVWEYLASEAIVVDCQPFEDAIEREPEPIGLHR